MEQMKTEQLQIFADALTQPAFAVKDGVVTYTNPVFATLQIGVGTPLADFFCAEPRKSGREFACVVAGHRCTATEYTLQDGTFFLLQLREQTVSANALTHTAGNIRSALQGIYGAASGLCTQIEENEDEAMQQLCAGLLHGIYRLEHTADNIELLQRLLSDSYVRKPEKTDIIAFLSELFSHADDLLQYADIRLQTELPAKLFSGYLDRTLAEAAIWNALSNAAANTQDGKIFVRAAHKNDCLQLTFINCGELSAAAQTQMFSRYQVPIEERFSDTGSGFGLSVIHRAVTLHGGTMLFAVKPTETVAFSVTFDLTEAPQAEVHSPIPVAHGLDLGLVHLSDVLPHAAYDTRDIL